jgi:transcriptional regulator with XRE-family HTH domain
MTDKNVTTYAAKRIDMTRYDSEAIANRVRGAREEARLSQEDVAVKLGLTGAGYGHYERSRQVFSVEQIFLLSRILNRPVEWLLGLETSLSDSEGVLLTAYRRIANPETQQMCLDIVTTIAERYPVAPPSS